MSSPSATVDESRLKWYQGIDRYAWIVLIIAALGWLFDAMDQNLFTLVRQPSIEELLRNQADIARQLASGELTEAALKNQAKVVGGQITTIFMIGWAVGGFVFGILGDRLGRTRTMIITILLYALFTGLNGLVQDIWQYGACRFLTALGVGGEFAAGASLVAEVWPNRSRPMALGTLQALSAVGNMAAAGINYFIGRLDWRYVYFIGAAPALLIVWIRRGVHEPEQWTEARKAAAEKGTTSELGNMGSLFKEPVLRRNTIAGVLLGAAGVGGLWGVGFFLPDLTGTVLEPTVRAMFNIAEKAPLTAEANGQLTQWRSTVFFIQQVGALLGMFSYAALSERVGRRPALAFFFLLAWASVVGTFWGLRDLNSACVLGFVMGFCALAPFSAFAVYFPELFPTRLRATGVGFCYNCARIVAAFAPSALGELTRVFASSTDPTFGFRAAASVVASIYVLGFVGLALAPETKGKPLPE